MSGRGGDPVGLWRRNCGCKSTACQNTGRCMPTAARTAGGCHGHGVPDLLPSCLPCSARRRLQDSGEAEVRGVQDEMHNLDAQAAQLDLEIREKEDDIKGLQVCLWQRCVAGCGGVGLPRVAREALRACRRVHTPAARAACPLQTEKELQSGGEVKELQAKVDELSKE